MGMLLKLCLIILSFMSFNTFADTPTQIRTMTPYFDSGHLNPNFIITLHSSGTCLTRSQANPGRANAWRCQSNNIYMDPCFQDSTSVSCMSSPWNNKVSLLDLKNNLPSRTQDKIDFRSSPWAIELQNKHRCTLMTQDSQLINGQTVKYVCRDESFVVLGELNRTTSTWTAVLYNTDQQKSQVVKITVAWY